MTTPIASIIIPIGAYHIQQAARAIASANAQTVACEVIPIVDDDARGTGWARNRGIEQATTDYLVFLDADDLLLPTFVERCWQMQQQTGRYIYTDFTDQHGKRFETPDCAWVNETWHAVTALIPADWVREVDGFDEDLREGGEDGEFFMHLCSSGHCGARLPEALLVYTNAPDTRSKRWINSQARTEYDALIEDRYLSKGKTAMGCCTEPAKKLIDPNAASPRMVLARPKWGGNHSERGLVTGTRYPSADRSQVVEVDPRDAAARPDRWEVIRQPAAPAPTPQIQQIVVQPTPGLAELAQRALQVRVPPPQPPPPPPPAPITPVMPDVGRVTRLAQQVRVPMQPQGGWRSDAGADYFMPTDAPATEQALKELRPLPTKPVSEWEKTIHIGDAMREQDMEREFPRVIPQNLLFPEHATGISVRNSTGDPVFVFPDKDYPSYTDVRRLVELSGFEARKPSEFNINEWENPANTFIVLAPGQPNEVLNSDVNSPLTHARAIWWSLEYGGEYEPDLTNWHGEVWASDPAWAKAHDAKMVVMGSHPDLAPLWGDWSGETSDVTMLAYITPRRETIKRQLADLAWPKVAYPGYGVEREQQLRRSHLMLHVHQHDDTHAIAPQRIALAAAYQMPIICESVPDAGEYGKWIPFVQYDNLNGEVRSQLAMMDEGIPQARAERLHNWLCVENTFRMSVEKALKS